MTDKKISELTVSGSVSDNDYFPYVVSGAFPQTRSVSASSLMIGRNADTVDGYHASVGGSGSRVIASYSTGSIVISGSASVTGSLILGGSIKTSKALGCRVINGSGQTITNAANNTLVFTQETDTFDLSGNPVDDTDNCWSSTSASALICKSPGWYLAGAGMGFNSHTAAWRFAISAFTVSGSTVMQLNQNEIHPIANSNAYISCTTGMFYMRSNDYVYFTVYQNTGGSKASLVGSLTSQNNFHGFLSRIA